MRPVYVTSKPKADGGNQQTGPSAHVGICHTYLTKCVTCREGGWVGWGDGEWGGGGKKSVTSSTASLSKSVPHSGSICHTPTERALGVHLERKREDCQLFRGMVPVRALKAAVQPGAGGGAHCVLWWSRCTAPAASGGRAGRSPWSWKEIERTGSCPWCWKRLSGKRPARSPDLRGGGRGGSVELKGWVKVTEAQTHVFFCFFKLERDVKSSNWYF